MTHIWQDPQFWLYLGGDMIVILIVVLLVLLVVHKINT
jgi:hypothetical protein